MASLYDMLQGQTEDNAYNRLAAMRQSYMPNQFQQAATPMNYRVNANPTVQGMQNGRPNYGYGNRYNSNMPKGTGYYGEVARPEGGYSGELSVDTGYGDIPSMVPGLTPDELQNIMTAGEGQQFNPSVYRKAASHAAFRQLNGLPSFASINDQPSLLPSRSGTMLSDLMTRK